MLTNVVSGGAKWTETFPSFDRIRHPFDCLFDLIIPQLGKPPPGGQTPFEKKPSVAQYAR